MDKDKESHLPLFETTPIKGRLAYQLYAASVFLAIIFIWVYRLTHFPATGEAAGRWAWIILSMAEFWFSFYWFLSQFVRWNPICRSPFKDRLPQDQDLPGVDVFVCTADRKIEPPIMVVNTVLSVMCYDYPPDKLSVYLSDDDGGSGLMFYALLEASGFAKHWVPFCKKFQVEPRCPEAYFSRIQDSNSLLDDPSDCIFIKKLYQDMKDRIETATRLGRLSDETRELHEGFCEWDSHSSSHDHQAIIQILISGMGSASLDAKGRTLPTLVYVAREKSKGHHHNFKAGAMNTLLRVSSVISNGSIILNVDCDMYSNNSESVRDALCFFTDKEKGREIAYVQFPPSSYNLAKDDMYASYMRVPNELEMGGMDGNGGPCYIGSGCFHRRYALCGGKYGKDYEGFRETDNSGMKRGSLTVLEDRCKSLASCDYEKNTEWGKEIGLKYGFPTEDFVTGLAIQCRGWKSVYCNPERKGFMGVAPTTLLQVLVQHTRWSEGQFKMMLSKCCPFVYGYRKIPFKLQISYVLYLLWAPNCLATLSYVTIPQLCLLKGILLFPKVSSFWSLPFLYVIISQCIYSLGEFVWCGGTIKGWWNDQRMWLFKRTTSYSVALLETVLGRLGLSESGFIVTPKVVEEDVSKRYKEGLMEFGDDSPMFMVMGSIALINLLSLLWGLKLVVDMGVQTRVLEPWAWAWALQIGVCGGVVFMNLPVYEALFFRKDKGRIPTSITCKSVMLALLACTLALY